MKFVKTLKAIVVSWIIVLSINFKCDGRVEWEKKFSD